MIISCLNGQLPLDKQLRNQRIYYNLPNSVFWGRLSVESHTENELSK